MRTNHLAFMLAFFMVASQGMAQMSEARKDAILDMTDCMEGDDGDLYCPSTAPMQGVELLFTEDVVCLSKLPLECESRQECAQRVINGCQSTAATSPMVMEAPYVIFYTQNESVGYGEADAELANYEEMGVTIEPLLLDLRNCASRASEGPEGTLYITTCPMAGKRFLADGFMYLDLYGGGLFFVTEMSPYDEGFMAEAMRSPFLVPAIIIIAAIVLVLLLKKKRPGNPAAVESYRERRQRRIRQ